MRQQRKQKARVIYHIDMNCFYAAVEMAHDPSLKGKPVAIAGNPRHRRGIIVTSSYEARDYGVKTTMPLWEAKRLCPHLTVLPPNFERYRTASKKIFQTLAKITPLIEPVSIDEGYMDVTDIEHPKNPIDTAYRIQNHLKSTLDLPSSIGIGPNKFLAKMASDMKKPMGITVLRIRDLPEKLWPLPIEKMYGVGEKTAAKLREIQIKTIGDLAEADVYKLTQLLGINGERLKNHANGKDYRPVDPDAVNEFKSIGNSETLPYNTSDEAKLRQLLERLVNHVTQRMARREIVGRSVQIMIRYDHETTITRSKTLPHFIFEKEDILQLAWALFVQHWNLKPVRLLGVTVSDLAEKKHTVKQLDLFTYKDDLVQHTAQTLEEEYGKQIFKSLKDETKQRSPMFKTSFQKDFLDDYRRS